MIRDNKLKVFDGNGEEKEFDILFTFDLKETGKSYVVYTDYSKNDSGNIKTFCSSYDAKEEFPKLKQVREKFELNIINDILKSIQENLITEETY